MSNLVSLFYSSIGRKVVVGITGLFLISFLIVHLSGNMILFSNDGGHAFNAYTRFMTTSPIIRVAEVILVLGFLAHIIQALRLTAANSKARPTKYAYKNDAKSSSWFSRNMALSGSIVFIFLAVHISMFWGGFHFASGEEVAVVEAAEELWKVVEAVEVDGNVIVEAESYIEGEALATLQKAGVENVQATSMQEIVKQSFAQWWIVLFYVLAMILLGFHLNHGFQSAFRTMGWVHNKYMPIVITVGKAFAVLVPLLFALIPIYYFVTSLSA